MGAPPGFCAAPWLESVLYNDGSYRICCRNSRVFGNWKTDSLAAMWHGKGLQEFRQTIARGEYPDSDCAACHRAGTAQSLERILGTPLVNALDHLFQQGILSDEEKVALKQIADLFPEGAERVKEQAHIYGAVLDDFRARAGAALSEEASAEFNKVANILAIACAYHAGNPAPPVVGPFRQVQLIAQCNARCVMCPGKFTGEIENGGAIEEADISGAMAAPSDIVDFFCNGSEFLLFKGWKQVAHALRKGGSANLRLSTNGMLLTRETAEYLVDNRLIGHLNVSFNAGTQETLERVQKNVRWNRLIANVEHLLDYAEKQGVYFPLSFSFILMRSNLGDLPAFLRLVAGFKRRCQRLDPNVMLMGLENAGAKDYRSFLYEEHLAFAPAGEVRALIRNASEIACSENISVQLYNFGAFRTLGDLNAAGIPLQGFVEQPAADREQVEIQVRAGLDAVFDSLKGQAVERIQAEFSGLTAREKLYPLGDVLRNSWSMIGDAVLEFLAHSPLEPSQGLKNLFSASPAAKEFFFQSREQRRAQLASRLRSDLEVEYWRVFGSRIGFAREELADHHGEKFLPITDSGVLSLLATGTRVLGEDMREWHFVHVSDTFVYLHSEQESRREKRGFVVGAFILDEPPSRLPESILRMRERASRVLPLFGPPLAAPVARHGMRFVNQFSPGQLSPGALLLGADLQVWIFLRGRESLFYVATENDFRVRIVAKEFVLGALPFEAGAEGRGLRRALRRADFHRGVHAVKNRLVGRRKSKMLWKLSQMYRSGLKRVGVETDSDLVIR
ncbi:MAG: radical SAM protein [Bdellovibrionota bacterium]